MRQQAAADRLGYNQLAPWPPSLNLGRKSTEHIATPMYFWRIEKLKSEMAARPLSDREMLPYLVVFAALSSAAGYFPQPSQNLWDALGAVGSVLLSVVGTIYIYRQNGGASGQHFLQRYFAIGWVVTIRWLVVMALAAAVYFGTLIAVDADTESTHWYDVLFQTVIPAVIYWRIGHHVRDLAQRTATA
jgi:hypothetical protein